MSKFKIALSSGDTLNMSAPDDISNEDLFKLASTQLRKGETISGINEQEYIDPKKEMDAAIEKNRIAAAQGDDTWYERYQESNGDINTPIMPSEGKLETGKRFVAQTLFPLSYGKISEGKDAGYVAPAADAVTLGLSMVPGASQLRGFLPVAKTTVGKAARYILPSIGIEAGRGSAIEGISSEVEDRPFSPGRAAIVGGAGAALDIAPAVLMNKVKSAVKNISDAVSQAIEKKYILTSEQLKSIIDKELKGQDLTAYANGKMADEIKTVAKQMINDEAKAGKISGDLAKQYSDNFGVAATEVFSHYADKAGTEPFTGEFISNIGSMNVSESTKPILPYIAKGADEAFVAATGTGSKWPYYKGLKTASEYVLPDTSIKGNLASYGSGYVLPTLKPFVPGVASSYYKQ